MRKSFLSLTMLVIFAVAFAACSDNSIINSSLTDPSPDQALSKVRASYGQTQTDFIPDSSSITVPVNMQIIFDGSQSIGTNHEWQLRHNGVLIQTVTQVSWNMMFTVTPDSFWVKHVVRQGNLFDTTDFKLYVGVGPSLTGDISLVSVSSLLPSGKRVYVINHPLGFLPGGTVDNPAKTGQFSNWAPWLVPLDTLNRMLRYADTTWDVGYEQNYMNHPGGAWASAANSQFKNPNNNNFWIGYKPYGLFNYATMPRDTIAGVGGDSLQHGYVLRYTFQGNTVTLHFNNRSGTCAPNSTPSFQYKTSLSPNYQTLSQAVANSTGFGYNNLSLNIVGTDRILRLKINENVNMTTSSFYNNGELVMYIIQDNHNGGKAINIADAVRLGYMSRESALQQGFSL